MSETKKKPSAYAKLFNFFKSKAVINITVTLLAIIAVVAMFLMDQQNSFRREHLSALESNFVATLLDNIGWQRFNIQKGTWVLFGCVLLITLLLVIASTFSGVFVTKKAKNNANRFKSEKSAKAFYGFAYYGIVVLIAMLIICIAGLAGAFDNAFVNSNKVFLNLILTILICLAFMLVIPVAVFVIYSIYALIATIVCKIKNKPETVAETAATPAEVENTAAAEETEVKEEVKAEAKEEPVVTPAEVVEETVEEVKTETAPSAPLEDNAEIKDAATETTVAADETAATDIDNNKTAASTDEAANFFASMEGKQFVSKSFIGKMHQTDKTIQGYYGELKNYMLSFKRVRSSVSWNLDTFFIGRKAVAKLGFRGKTLVMFCALDPDEYANTKYYPKDVSGVKKYEATPMMVKVKSERGVKFAKELIDVMFKDLTPIDGFEPQKYTFARRTDKQLLEQDLAKYV